jgi:HSP20 family protein
MALDLSRWNPFQFARRGAEQRSSGGASQAGAAGAGGAAESAGRLLQAIDPFSLLPGLLRNPLAGDPGSRWFGDFSPALFQPQVDVVDEGDALRISAELPGMDKQDLEVLLEDGFLVLRGEKRLDARKEEKGCYRLERAFGNFQRILPLPEGVDASRAEATFNDGVLTLRLPKTTAAAADTSRKLEIK